MRYLFYLSHPQVNIDPEQPVTDWSLSNQGWARVMALAGRRWPKAPAHVFSSQGNRLFGNIQKCYGMAGKKFHYVLELFRSADLFNLFDGKGGYV